MSSHVGPARERWWRDVATKRLPKHHSEGTVCLKGSGLFSWRGNVVDLAVAVVLGAAFGTVVTALVKDIITPIIAALVGKPDFSSLGFDIN